LATKHAFTLTTFVGTPALFNERANICFNWATKHGFLFNSEHVLGYIEPFKLFSPKSIKLKIKCSMQLTLSLTAAIHSRKVIYTVTGAADGPCPSIPTDKGATFHCNI